MNLGDMLKSLYDARCGSRPRINQPTLMHTNIIVKDIEAKNDIDYKVHSAVIQIDESGKPLNIILTIDLNQDWQDQVEQDMLSDAEIAHRYYTIYHPLTLDESEVSTNE